MEEQTHVAIVLKKCLSLWKEMLPCLYLFAVAALCDYVHANDQGWFLPSQSFAM